MYDNHLCDTYHHQGVIAGRYVAMAVGGVEVMCFEVAAGQANGELAMR